MEPGKDTGCFMGGFTAAVLIGANAENRKVGCAIEVLLLPTQMLQGRVYAGVYCAAVIIATL